MEFRVGLPTDGKKRWRCDICSLLNVWENNECKRCKEPMDEQRKKKLYLKPRKIEGTTPRIVSNNNTNKSNNYNKPNNYNRSKSTFSKKKVSKSNSNNVKIYEFNKSKKNQKEKNTFGFNKNKNIKKIKTTNKNSYKPLRKENLSEKHLGYRSSKKRVNTYVRSKLNHDTAAYRAKFSDKENKNSLSHKISGMKKGVPVYTMNDLTKNGFQTRINHKPNQPIKNPIKKNNKSKYNYQQKRKSINKKIVSLHDERPVTPPPKKAPRGKGQKKRSLIDMLQKECSGEIMANLRQGGRYIRKEKKNMEGGKSKYDL